jgi:hypothetical protein
MTGSEHERFLQITLDCLARYLSNVLRLNVEHKQLTFVLGFIVPQQNPLGTLSAASRSSKRDALC